MHVARCLASYFGTMLTTGPRLLLLLCALDLALPATFSYYSGLHQVRPVGTVGMTVCLVAAAVACLISVRHFVTLHRFASAEVSAMSGDG
jgi:high-affinity K+ transport system ATPase subunit B